MNAFLSLFKRKALFPVLITLLLLLAISITSAGAAMRIGVARQVADVSNNYVTIAVMRDDVVSEDSVVSDQIARGTPEVAWETPIVGEYDTGSNYNPMGAHKAAMNSGFIEAVDARYIMGAQVMGSKALVSCATDLTKYNNSYDSGYNMAVLAVKCKSVEEEEFFADELGNPYVTYNVGVEIIDAVSLADGYPDLDDESYLTWGQDGYILEERTAAPGLRDATLTGGFYLDDGTIPFQVGHTYLVSGVYCDIPYLTVFVHDPMDGSIIERTGRNLDYERTLGITNYRSTDFEGMTIDTEGLDALCHRHRGVRSDGKTFFYPLEEEPPLWAEYSGSWEDFLASEEGRIWREEIIPLCEINQSSATVLLSDNLQSMYVFNTGEAGLLEGRFFTEEEYASGSEVCMISASYAQYNGYQIGDKLTLDLYDTGFYEGFETVDGWSYRIVRRGVCLPDKRIDVKKEYEIVGIYSAPEMAAGGYKFRADTILLPKKSVPGSEKFERFNGTILYSLILKNGTQEAFQAYMEQAGFKDAFLYFDQGYSATEGSIGAMNENAMRILWIGLATLVLTAALAHFLSLRRFAPAARTMRLLGIDRRKVQRQAFGMLLLTDAVAAVLGVGLAAALFSRITESALSLALKPEPLVLAACAGVIFLLLMILSLICARALSNMPLMHAGRKGSKQK